uniref:Ubiquitin-like protease family profile domain-containing protein n=1 Tax=Brassica oleracea var. oleracea TaxID=109376 RepID=A0A0D3CT82_BRAOL
MYTTALQEKIDVDTKSDQEQAVMPNSAGPSNIVVREDEIGSGDDLTDEDAAEAKEGCRTVVLSDSPTELAPKHVPVADEEELAALLLANMHLDAGGRDLDNEFFLQLATPGVWVNSTHMEVLMEYSERRYGLGVHLERGMFVAPWFTAHMQGKGRSFKAARRKTGVAGDAKITNYLTRPRQRWGMEVDRLYTPMIWGGTHWVGLCISLSDWAIYVFDPNPLGKTIEQVEELLEPVSTMLPYVAKKVCPAEAVGERAQVPFRVERVTGLYVNRRSGDCGPVAVKFLEMHATGDRKPTMAGLTDDLVDIFRKHYAMDIYRGVVVPLYLR